MDSGTVDVAGLSTVRGRTVRLCRSPVVHILMALARVRCRTAVPTVPLRPRLLLLRVGAAVAVVVLAALLPTLHDDAQQVASLAHPRASRTPRLVDHVADSTL